mgnify:CR=1 FL=1
MNHNLSPWYYWIWHIYLCSKTKQVVPTIVCPYDGIIPAYQPELYAEHRWYAGSDVAIETPTPLAKN